MTHLTTFPFDNLSLRPRVEDIGAAPGPPRRPEEEDAQLGAWRTLPVGEVSFNGEPMNDGDSGDLTGLDIGLEEPCEEVSA